MRAFQNVRTEMRETCTEVSQPQMQDAPPARIGRRQHRESGDAPDGAIEPWMEAAFEGLTHASETGDPFALVPCFMNGKPAAVIALARPLGRKVHVMPLFLACQPWMKFSSAPGESGEEEGGGPDRTAADPPAPR